MFQHLLESKAVRRPRVGGSLVSTIAHAALIAAAVPLTTRGIQEMEAIAEPVAQYIPVVPPLMRDVVHTVRNGGVEAAAAPPSLRAIAPLLNVLDIPVGIASPDLTRPVIDASDFASRRASAGPIGDGKGTGATEGSAWLEAQVDKPVVMLAGVAMPTYPALLRSAGIAGAVLVEFVVDTLGRVEPGSLRVLQSDHELFAASVREVVPRMRFMPAEVGGGRKVRQLVRLPFQFDLNRDASVEANIDAPNTNVGLIRF